MESKTLNGLSEFSPQRLEIHANTKLHILK